MDHQTFPASLRSSFEPIKLLGQGGMGTVWSAKRLPDGKKVAIKVLLPHLHTDETFRRRFSREALVGQQIAHPGLVSVLDSGVVEEQAYIVSQFVEGQSLDKVLKHYGALEEGAAIDVVLQVGRALAALHQNGVIHRDIKPENVIVKKDGTVKVLDFGLARCLEEGQTVTNTGIVVGTPAFMAPEVCCGRALDPRTDVFSVGLLFIACLEGKKSIMDSSMSPLELLKKRAVNKETPQLSDKYSRRLRRLVSGATAYSPQERFPDCSAFVAALEDYRKPRENEQATETMSKELNGPPDSEPFLEKLPTKRNSMTPFVCLFSLLFSVLVIGHRYGQSEPKTSSTQATFIALRQSLLQKNGPLSAKELKEFGKLLGKYAPEIDFPSAMMEKERALLYLGRFLSRSWQEREDDERKVRLAHRTASLYLQCLHERPNLTSSSFDQTVLQNTYAACISSQRYDDLLDKLRLMNLSGTIAYLRDYYVARAIFKKTEQSKPSDHEKRTAPHPGFIESEKLLRPLVERLARSPFEPPLVHINGEKVIEAYAYCHHFIRLKAAKRSLMTVTRQLTGPGSLLSDRLKFFILHKAHSELVNDLRDRRADDPLLCEQDILDALECIGEAQQYAVTEKELNELNFALANVYRRADRFKEAYEALKKVSIEKLDETSLFEYYIKRGYIMSGLTKYREACQSFNKAQLHSRSDDNRKHAKLQWEKARLQKAYEEAKSKR